MVFKKTVGVGRDGRRQENNAFQIKNGCTYELTEPVAAHTGPSRIQATWGLGVERESGHELPSITQKLSSIDNSL